MKQALGIAMIAAPFVVWAVVGARLIGWKTMVLTFAGVAALVAWFFASAFLIGDAA